ncbi:MAG: zinc ribbon domain-containing protein [Calditrichaeota bacterium]|nr:zinc ribbon domain-containing protein [Calditrichota bacterium]
MPTYEYRCRDCGFEFEEFQSISDAPLNECPSCAGTLERLISGGVGLIFKGSGFYITDYARKHSSGASGRRQGQKTSSPTKGKPSIRRSSSGKSRK